MRNLYWIWMQKIQLRCSWWRELSIAKARLHAIYTGLNARTIAASYKSIKYVLYGHKVVYIFFKTGFNVAQG